jgi:hypothetical protein
MEWATIPSTNELWIMYFKNHELTNAIKYLHIPSKAPFLRPHASIYILASRIKVHPHRKYINYPNPHDATPATFQKLPNLTLCPFFRTALQEQENPMKGTAFMA